MLRRRPVRPLFPYTTLFRSLRDLGSRNGSWIFIEQPTKLIDGDLILIGSQMLKFRRLGYPGPHPPEADSTRRMGSVTPPVRSEEHTSELQSQSNLVCPLLLE